MFIHLFFFSIFCLGLESGFGVNPLLWVVVGSRARLKLFPGVSRRASYQHLTMSFPEVSPCSWTPWMAVLVALKPPTGATLRDYDMFQCRSSLCFCPSRQLSRHSECLISASCRSDRWVQRGGQEFNFKGVCVCVCYVSCKMMEN